MDVALDAPGLGRQHCDQAACRAWELGPRTFQVPYLTHEACAPPVGTVGIVGVVGIVGIVGVVGIAADRRNGPGAASPIRRQCLVDSHRLRGGSTEPHRLRNPHHAKRSRSTGRLEEPAWKLATPATDFIQNTPRPGEPARHRTEVRFLYDDTNLYVGVTCFQSDRTPASSSTTCTGLQFRTVRRDQFILDTLHDRRSGFMFMTNPGGARRDGQISNDGEPATSTGTACGMSRSAGTTDGWIAEFMIPFKTLRFSKLAVAGMGLQHDQGRSARE